MDPLFDVVAGRHLNEWDEKKVEEEEEGVEEEKEEEDESESSNSDEEKEGTKVVAEAEEEKVSSSINPYFDRGDYDQVDDDMEQGEDLFEEELKNKKRLHRQMHKLEIQHSKRVYFALNAILTYIF